MWLATGGSTKGKSAPARLDSCCGLAANINIVRWCGREWVPVKGQVNRSLAVAALLGVVAPTAVARGLP